jgi:hypothetical protein
MWDGGTESWNLEEGLLRLFDCLGDRLWDFLRLAVTDAEGSVSVTDDDKCGEGETTSTLHDLGDAIYEDDALDVRALLSTLFAWTTLAAIGLCRGWRVLVAHLVIRWCH